MENQAAGNTGAATQGSNSGKRTFTSTISPCDYEQIPKYQRNHESAYDRLVNLEGQACGTSLPIENEPDDETGESDSHYMDADNSKSAPPS